MNTVIRLIFVCAALLAPARSQGNALEKARLIEEAEQNPKRAASQYRAIARATKDPKLLARARLGLARCLVRLGQLDAAERELGEVAKGAGPEADEAKAMLQGGDAQRGARLERRVAALVAQLQKGVDTDRVRRDLVWFGDAAVPVLVKSIDADQFDLGFVKRAVNVLLELGGPKVEAFLTRVASSNDTLLKRAVVSGFQFRSALDEALRQAMVKFVDDPDPAVRTETIVRIYKFLPKAKLIELTRAPDSTVRARALNGLSRYGRGWVSEPGSAALRKQLIAALRTCVQDRDAGVRGAVSSLWFTDSSELLWFEAGREFYLDSVARTDLGLYTKFDRGLVFDPAPGAPAVLAAARALGPVARDHDGKRVLSSSQDSFATFVKLTIARWGREQTQAVLDLVELGYDSHETLSTWIIANARPADLPRTIELLADFDAPSKITAWLAKGKDLGGSLGVLKNAVNARLTRDPKSLKGPVRDLLTAIGQVKTREAAEFLVSCVRRDASLYQHVTSILFTDWPWTAVEPALADMLAIPSGIAVARGLIFQRLAMRGSDTLLRYAARAYEAGMSGTRPMHTVRLAQTREYHGIQWLLVLDRFGKRACPLDGKTVTRIVDTCLPNERAWPDVCEAVQGASSDIVFKKYAIPESLAALLCRRALECPRKDLRRMLVGHLVSGQFGAVDEAQKLALTVLRGTDAYLRSGVLASIGVPLDEALIEEVRRALDDPDASLVLRAMNSLAGCSAPERFDWIAAKLTSKNSSVRKMAVSLLATHQSESCLPKILPLMRDPSPVVRLEVISATRRFLDQSAVPMLLEALRDTGEDVRKQAKAALDAIRFYNEQKAHWDRWLNTTKLGASPGDALLKQASPDQPKRIRLVAIASLGTLGKPESLPFLIELMREPDKDIAKAAGLAANRINASGGK